MQAGGGRPYALVLEFMMRKALASIGFTAPLAALDSLKAEVFTVLAGEFELFKVEKIKTAIGKG